MILFKKAKRHILENIKLYTLLLVFFLIGAGISVFAFFTLGEAQQGELVIYLSDFLKAISLTSGEAKDIITPFLITCLKVIAVSLVFSNMVIGKPFLYAICAYFGFSSFFTVLMLFKSFGFFAICIIFAGLIPHWILLFPAYSYFMVSCFLYQQRLTFRTAGKHDRGFLNTFFYSIVLTLLVSFGAGLMQGYIEPYLLGLVSKYYI